MQKKILSRTLKALLAVLMCFGVLQTQAFGVKEVLADDEPTTSINASKTITDEDGDGVYDLTLQVTGSSESSSTTTVKKSNVVLVIDTSGSMGINYTYSTYTYSSSTYNAQTEYYGVNNNGNYVRVTRNYQNNGWRYYDNYNAYNGTVYTRQTRMEATKAAAVQLVDALLGNNKDQVKDGVSLNDIVEISLVTFAGASNTRRNGYLDVYDNKHYSGITTASDATSLKNTINGLDAVGGTNWEAALKAADTSAATYASQTDETTSVIFLTDGMPTFYGTNDSGTGGEGGTWQVPNRDNVHTSWNNADDDARKIVTDGYTFYTIFAFGNNTALAYDDPSTQTDADYLKALTHYAYTGSGTYSTTSLTGNAEGKFFNASDTRSLEEAFRSIASSIAENIGYGGVMVDDGVTTGVTNTSITVGGKINPSTITYKIKDGSTTLATVKIDDENDSAVFTIDGNTYDGNAVSVDTVTTNINGTDHVNKVYSVTVGEKTYKMSPASMDKNGKIQWELTGIGILENGITYEMTFEVWPNQFSYDIVADLNNGVKTLEQVKQEVITAQGLEAWNKIEQALVINGNKYSIRTNYEQYVDYYTVDTQTDDDGNTTTTYEAQPRKELGPKDPVALTSTTMDMVKAWEDSLDEAQFLELLYEDYPTNTVPTKYQVKLHIWKADTKAELENLVNQYSEPVDGSYAQADAHDYMAKTLGWSEAKNMYVWDDDLEVAPGTMLTLSKAEEMGIDTSDASKKVTYNGTTYFILESGHYYYVTEENIDRHFQLNTIVYHPMLVDGKLNNVTFKDDGTVEKIEPLSKVTAENTLRGGINVKKSLVDAEGNPVTVTQDSFKITIAMKKADGTDYLDWDYRIYYGENNPNAGTYDPENDNYGRSAHNYGTEKIKEITGSAGEIDPVNGGKNTITLDYYVGDEIRVINVDAGVTFTVTEDTAALAGTIYQYDSTEYKIQVGDNDPVDDTAHVVKGNSANKINVINKVVTADINVIKTGTVENKEKLAGVKFQLYYDEAWTKLVKKDSLGNVVGRTDGEKEHVLVSDADGKIALGTFIPGTYYLKEIETVEGYALIETPIAITVNEEGQVEYEGETVEVVTVPNEEVVDYSVEKKWNVGEDTTLPESVTVNLYTVDGEEEALVTDVKPLVLTADEWKGEWTGLPKYDADGNTIKYVAKEVEIEGFITTSETKDYSAVITNTEATESTVIKYWNDADDQDGVRPTSLKVTMSDGTEITLTAEDGDEKGNNWTATVENLPKYDKDGKEISYTWTEDQTGLPTGYQLTDTKVSDDKKTTTFTNTYKPKETNITVNKKWNDASNQDGKRSDVEATVTLYKTVNGEKAEVETVNVPYVDGQIKKWENLPVYEDGYPITYSVVETLTTANGYTANPATEVTVENGSITTITNSYTPEETQVTATKTWADNNNQDGKRPTTATVQLYAQPEDGEKTAVGDPVTVPATDGTIKVWEHLPVYEDGKKITYSVEETLPEGSEYSKSGDTTTLPAVKDDSGTVAITNSYEPKTTGISVTKTWADNNNQDGIRSSLNAKVTLYKVVGDEDVAVTVDQDGNKIEPVDVPTADGTVTTWSNLPVYEKGVAIQYKVVETYTGTGYTETYENQVITATPATDEKPVAGTVTVINTHTPDTTERTVVKVWDDNDDQDGIRPTTLKVNLMNGTTVVKEVTLTEEDADEDGNWTETVSNLPVNANGTPITYTWTEDEDGLPEGYELTGNTTEGQITTLTNSYTPQETKVTATKTWTDANNQDGKRPTTATVQLYAQPEGGEKTAVGDPVTVPATDGTIKVWEHLPVYEDGKQITYSVVETLPDATYTKNGDTTTLPAVKDDSGTIAIENSYTPKTTDVKVTKTWDDANDQDGKRKNVGATVQLKANGENVGDPVPVGTADDWSKTWEDLPVYAGGTPIKYTVVETLPDGSEYEKSGDDTVITADETKPLSGTVEITNSYTPEVQDLTVIKKWNDNENQDGKRPESITVTLKANGEIAKDADGKDIVVTLKGSDWKATVTGLPVYADGSKITYTWVEEDLSKIDYSIEDQTTVELVTTITNKHTPDETSATVIKVWDDNDDQDGIRPEELVVALLANDKPYLDGEDKPVTVKLTEDNSWTGTVSGLPKNADGEPIKYTWDEGELPEGYELTDTSVEGTVTTLTNSHTPAETEATVKKEWDDKDNQDGIRPETLKVTLSNGKEVTLNEGNGWSATVENLPKYNNGVEIEYTWTEGTLPEGYKLTNTSKEGTVTTLTNSHTPAETEATVKKVWDDKDNQDGIRPTELKVTLSNGTEVTLNEGNGWSATVDKLPKFKDGVEIEYTWTEGTLPEGYKLTKNEKEGTITTLTNSHTPEVIDITVEKVWVDNDNNDGKRPTEITVSLQADGTAIRQLTLNKDNSWKETVEGLPKYQVGEVGKEVKYTVLEIKVTDYGTTYAEIVDGKITVTNTHEDELINIPVKKVWVDENNKYGVRPDHIEIVLLADGKEADSVYLTDEKLEHTFEKLHKYENGKEITYKVVELMPEDAYGYSSDGGKGDNTNGWVFTNTYHPIPFDPPVVKTVKGDKTEVSDEFTFQLEAVTAGAPMPEGSVDGKKTITIPADGDPYEFGMVYLTTKGEFKYTISEIPGEDTMHYGYDETVYELLFNVTTNDNNELVCELTVSDGETTTEVPWEQLKEFPFEFENEYRDYVTLEIEKVWDDNNDSQKLRPAEVEIEVLANDEVIFTVVLNEDNNWKFEKVLPYSDGDYKPVTYSVNEKNIPEGYTVSYSQNEYKFTVTNTVTPPETSDASGISMWLAMFGVSVTNSLGLAYVSLKRKKEEQF